MRDSGTVSPGLRFAHPGYEGHVCMFDDLATRVNGNAALVRRGRYVTHDPDRNR